ncbi:acyltransferase family protein, partial [Micrococcus luteus]|uniref:acyltransferase family protein n=2 Tax=Micrococcaceae TaxID=1268 RepID=UPI003F81618E
LIFTLGLAAPKRAFQSILGGWVLITGVLSLIPTDNTYLKFLGNPLHFEFIFGALVGYLVTRRIIWKPLLVTMAGVSLSLAWWALMWAGVGPGVASDAFRVPTIGLALAISLYGVIGLETVGAFTFPAWLQKLGDSSYSLYLTHILTITAFGAAFALVPKSPVTHVAGLLGIIAACIIGGLIYYRVAERP